MAEQQLSISALQSLVLKQMELMLVIAERVTFLESQVSNLPPDRVLRELSQDVYALIQQIKGHEPPSER